jgi:hypothetical protein
MTHKEDWWNSDLRARIDSDVAAGRVPNYDWLSPTLKAGIEADVAAGKSDWVLSEVVQMLRAEGLPVTVHKIRNALATGRVTRPDLDGAGNMRFTVPNIVQICDYLLRPPKPGRRSKKGNVEKRDTPTRERGGM